MSKYQLCTALIKRPTAKELDLSLLREQFALPCHQDELFLLEVA